MKEQKDIEALFKEKFNQFEVDPGMNAWANIQSGIGSTATTASTAAAASSSWLTTAIIAVGIAGAAIGGYYLFNQSLTPKEEKVTKQEPKTEEFEKSTLKHLPAIEEPKSKLAEKVADQLDEPKSSTETSQSIQGRTDKISKTSVLNQEKENLSDPSIDQKSEVTSEVNPEPIIKNQTEDKVATKEPLDEQIEIQTESVSDSNSESETKNSTTSETVNDPPESLVQSEQDKPEIYFPNIFTPNGDGVNDEIGIVKEKSKGLDNLENIEVIIMSKTGKIIARWNDINGSWDGTLPNGNRAPYGQYLYQILIRKNGKEFTANGIFSLEL